MKKNGLGCINWNGVFPVWFWFLGQVFRKEGRAMKTKRNLISRFGSRNFSRWSSNCCFSGIRSSSKLLGFRAATVTLSDAKAIALQTAGSGKVVSIDLDGNKAGAVYYDVTVLDGFTEKSTRLMLEQEAFSKPRKSQLMTMRTCNGLRLMCNWPLKMLRRSCSKNILKPMFMTKSWIFGAVR